jgi:Txe/YoeB family toxin of toxin-antitoxin system
MAYLIKFSKRGKKDYEKVEKSPLKTKALDILNTLEANPYKPPFESLSNDLKNMYSRRLNKQHRIVYTINELEKHITIISMWTHYEKL